MSDCSKTNLKVTFSIYLCFLLGICIYNDIQYFEVGDWGSGYPLNVKTT